MGCRLPAIVAVVRRGDLRPGHPAHLRAQTGLAIRQSSGFAKLFIRRRGNDLRAGPTRLRAPAVRFAPQVEGRIISDEPRT